MPFINIRKSKYGVSRVVLTYVLSDQLSKTKDIQHRKADNPYILEAGTKKWLALMPEE